MGGRNILRSIMNRKWVFGGTYKAEVRASGREGEEGRRAGDGGQRGDNAPQTLSPGTRGRFGGGRGIEALPNVRL